MEIMYCCVFHDLWKWSNIFSTRRKYSTDAWENIQKRTSKATNRILNTSTALKCIGHRQLLDTKFYFGCVNTKAESKSPKQKHHTKKLQDLARSTTCYFYAQKLANEIFSPRRSSQSHFNAPWGFRVPIFRTIEWLSSFWNNTSC